MTFLEVTLALLRGFGTTCLLFAETLALSLPLGLCIAFCLLSKFKAVRYVFNTIVWIIRGTPLMLQLFVVFYVPGMLFGIQLFSSRFIAALVAFVINYACYFAVIFKGGIESVPQSQTEAAQMLGMTKWQIFKNVILLQVIRSILAPTSNEVITLVKDTSLARVISVADIMFVAANEILSIKALIWPMFYTAVFYLVFVGLLTITFNWLEKKVGYYKI